MSQFSRPRPRFNRQVCQDVRLNLGMNQYGIANQRPNNPLYFTLASLRKGVIDGAFMKTTSTGTKLPNPVKELKQLIKPPPSGGGKNPPHPRIADINAYTVRQGQDFNPRVRQEAMQQMQAQLRGRVAVAQRPNVLRREIQTNIRPMARDVQRRRVVKGMGKKDAPTRIVRGMGKKDIPKRVVRGMGKKDEPKKQPEISEEKAKEIRGFFEKLLEDSKKSSTPGTAVQPSRERGKPAKRRQLVMTDDVKKETPGTEIKD